jgi:DUF971 family protein
VATVTDIDIDRERSVTITFDDGRVCAFGLEELRRACPCATCRSWRDRGEPAWPRPGQHPTLRVEDAQLVGASGLVRGTVSRAARREPKDPPLR